MSDKNSCCSSESKNKKKNKFNNDFVVSSKITEVGFIPIIGTELNSNDRWEHFKCRISTFRNNYKIEPGIYAVGNPDKNSDVLISANYKYSFDVLRKELNGLNCWILVIDTNGVNVWCAAGKGTFGTGRLVMAIKKYRLEKVVDHRKIIVPQFGAVGVSAHEVKKSSKFEVIYGPLHAKDIKCFIDNNYQASEMMRTIKFPIWDRLVVAPLELIPALKYYKYVALFLLIFLALKNNGIIFKEMFYVSIPVVLLGFFSIVIGTIIVPIFLPYIPFRSFALKGVLLGLIPPIISIFAFSSIALILFCWILFPAISSFTALQFTGTTTYTSPSGVRKELKIGIPIYMAAGLISAVILLIHQLIILGAF